MVRDEAPPHIMPIKDLNQYINRWTIRARVTAKSDIRRYSNVRGEGAPRHCSSPQFDGCRTEIRSKISNALVALRLIRFETTPLSCCPGPSLLHLVLPRIGGHALRVYSLRQTRDA